MTARFSLGIDLGTSNCAMALTDLDTDRTEIVPIPQILAANQLGEKPTLASALYLPHPEEFRPGSFPLPWDNGLELGIVGQFARDHGALVPDRLVTSAKSWLSNPHIDPKQRTLPWRSDSAEEKLSPFDCSRRYLQHLKGAFLQTAQAQGTAVGTRRRPDRGDGARLVRRGRAKPDGRSGGGRRTGPRHVAGGTAGRLLRLGRAGRPAMARCGDAGRHHPGVRRRWRHRRLQPDRRDRCRRQPGTGAHQRRRTHPARRRQHGSGAGLHAAGQAGGRRQVAGCLAVPGAGACGGTGEDHLVRGRQPGGSADRGALARLQPVCQDDCHGARSRLAVAGRPRRVLRADRARRSAARGTADRTAGIRPALRVRSGDQQASGPLPHPQPAECAGERTNSARWSGPAPAGRR